MKMFILAISYLIGSAGLTLAAQPHNVGSIKASKIVLEQRSLAQINLLTPDTTGQLVLCNNCTRSSVCVSSGLAQAAFVILVTTGTKGAGYYSGFEHCQ